MFFGLNPPTCGSMHYCNTAGIFYTELDDVKPIIQEDTSRISVTILLVTTAPSNNLLFGVLPLYLFESDSILL